MKKIIVFLILALASISSFGQVNPASFSSVTTPKIRIRNSVIIGDVSSILHAVNGHLLWGNLRIDSTGLSGTLDTTSANGIETRHHSLITYEPIIAGGLSNQYYGSDKQWHDFPASPGNAEYNDSINGSYVIKIDDERFINTRGGTRSGHPWIYNLTGGNLFIGKSAGAENPKDSVMITGDTIYNSMCVSSGDSSFASCIHCAASTATGYAAAAKARTVLLSSIYGRLSCHNAKWIKSSVSIGESSCEKSDSLMCATITGTNANMYSPHVYFSSSYGFNSQMYATVGGLSSFGAGTLQFATGGLSSAFGTSAATFTTSGSGITANGYESSYANTTGSDITSGGVNSAHDNKIGSYGTSYGARAAQHDTCNSGNVDIGADAGGDRISGINGGFVNVGIHAGKGNLNGYQCTNVGALTGQCTSSAIGQLNVGWGQGYSETRDYWMHIGHGTTKSIIEGDLANDLLNLNATVNISKGVKPVSDTTGLGSTANIGMITYDTTNHKFYGLQGGTNPPTWVPLGSAGGSGVPADSLALKILPLGNVVMRDPSKNIVLGTGSPDYKLSVYGDIFSNSGIYSPEIFTPNWHYKGGSSMEIAWNYDWTGATLSSFSLTGCGQDGTTTDGNGGAINIKAGKSTGTGTSEIHLFTATAGTTGTTIHTPTEKITILGSGAVRMALQDTTGIGSTANVGCLPIYKNGHYYGLVAGTPPTWKQLDN